jgi:hypothetical protein
MWRLDGSAEPVEGNELDACLRAEMKRSKRAGDTRSKPQQRWDALLCEAHHIVAWPDGPTDLDNLTLPCIYECHWHAHEGQYGPRSNWGKDPP